MDVASRWLACCLLAPIGACASANDASSAGGDTSSASESAASEGDGMTTSSASDTVASDANDTSDATADSSAGDASSSTTGDVAPPGPCDPARSVEPWNGSWQPPHALHLGVCTPQEASAIASCFVEAQSCEVPVTVACHACAVSGPESPEAAPLQIDRQGQLAGLNIAGCVAQLDGDPSEAGCGPKLEAYLACLGQACAACDDPELLEGCRVEAEATTCSALADAAACATPYLPQCTGDTVLETAFELVAIFCGP